MLCDRPGTAARSDGRNVIAEHWIEAVYKGGYRPELLQTGRFPVGTIEA